MGILDSDPERSWDNQHPVFLRATQWEPDFDLTVAGENGWELVSVVPGSGVAGGSGESSSDFAGFTNERLWIFKRPKPAPAN